MAEMCDNCSEITSVLESFIERIELDKATQEYESDYEFDSNDYRFIKRHLILTKREADMLFNCIQSWYQRQCICLYSDVDAYDRLVETIFCLIRLLIKQLCIYNHQAHIVHTEQSASESFIVEKIPGWYPDSPDEDYTMSEDHWTYNEIERLFHLVSKVVTMNFVLYVPIKLIQAKNMELLRTFKSVYSDFKETEIPLGLLRNVDLFCKSEGFQHLKNLFTYSNLPLSIANSAVTLACNLKVWLNVKHVTDLFLPFRSAVLKYMCNITEKDPKSKYMTEFMWNMIKDPLETPIIFDKDGLEFAYKFFTSTTLTVRLSGITQINSYVATFNASTCSEEEASQHASNFAAWFLEKDILSYIFGPNLHVEIIKLSQPVLQFLAIESKITTDDIDIMWQAAQLKHCSKQVFDVLAPLVKNLEPSLIIHLYRLLYKLEPKEHSEQSLHLATCILKHMWLSSATHNLHLPEHLKLIKWDASNIASLAAAAICRTSSPCKRIKSANSVSNKKKKTDIISTDCEKVYTNFEKVLSEKKSDTQINDESDRCFDSDNGRVVVESLKRAKSSSNEDIKDGHEDKKQKSELVNENSEQSKCIAVPVDSTDSRIDISDDEEIDVDDNGEHEALHHLANDDEEDDENELTESDEENHAGCLQSALKTAVHDQQVPNILISDVTEDTLSGDDGSVSSRMSTKSEKNMADFDGEDAVCDDEIVQLGSHAQLAQNNLIAQRIAHMTFHSQFNNNDHGGHEHNNLLHCQNKQRMKSVRLMQEQKLQSRDTTPFLRYYNLDTIYKPGSTLVWDIVQNPKIALLAENTAYEAEKCLATLICYNADKNVRMRFIEACLHNIHTNRSVPVSLRLLPKIFASFHQVDNSGGMDVKQVTLWAFHSLKMIPIFFSNLNHYIKNELSTDFHTHLINIQARLSFLTYVYSHVGLPDSVRLTSTDLDNLWKCLVSNDIRISDEFFTWLLRQVKGKEQHAFTADTLKHLYCKLVPSLPPQNMTLISLALLQQLCNMCRCRDSILKICGDKIAMNHIWKVALRAINTDVSMSAIQNINMYYINRQLQHEPEFVRHCMRYIAEAAKDIKTNEESSLSCIQRALLLLKTHLDMFRRRYAYHIRRYALQGKRVSSHVVTLDTYVHPINLYIHPAGCIERMALEIYSNEYISELRAEVVSWWYKSATDTSAQCSGTPQESHVRIITQGQEIFHDFDDKTVAELGLKDQQILYISLGTVRQKKKNDTTEIPSLLPPPNVENLPINLLLLPQNFNALFDIMHMLSTFEGTSAQAHMKAQILSRRVWDILIMLPTKPKLLQGFEELRWREKEHLDLNILLDPTSPQKLIYSLYIVEYLSRNGDFTNKPNEELNKIDELPETVEWCEAFIQKGGLEHLFNIFISGKLQGGSEWQQDCLAHLLKLLCLLGTYSKELSLQNSDKKSDKSREKDKRSLNETYNLVRRKSYLRQQHSEFQKRQYRQYEHQHERKTDDHSEDDIPRLNTVMEHLMTANDVMPRFTSILMEMATPKELAYYKTGFWGKGQVIHYAMKLLICWSKTCSDVCRMLFSTKNFSQWLCKLVLEDHDPIVRRETSAAVYKLCATSKNGFLNLYNDLVKYIDKAERMKPHDHDTLHHPLEEGKEPYGPTCRDYFWLLSRLVDNLPEEVTDESSSSTVLEVNLNELANKVWSKIDNREYIEKRHNPLEDDGLIGMLNLLTIILKYEQRFKFSDVGADALNKTFQFLFEVPDAEKRHVPKCKSPAAKVAAYDLLLELAKNCSDNFKRLYSKLLQQHLPGPNSPYPWEYWPHDDERAECGFVGLTNLGATCYMASCMQHLYMMPEARYSILNSQTDENTKHRDILLEIQKMFAYMLESERKTYNPRSFCKVYTMDHQPLNTGEQKDMAEFFIDLVSKLEEMTPDLKELVKSLFGGIISNNVVSLDCDHVSRTREEFYTVRCQVADMKSLIESLNEVTVKDTLEGDNMYTCSQCGRKVRAEKRACFRRLPKILCFNTMRYTFNMITMLKEKVNTHFSFPMRLDMSYYLEKYLMPQQFQEEKEKALEECKEAGKPIPNEFTEEETYEYELIGVTVHTGNADGGHYYSFIRDPSHSSRRDKWYYFNDAEVKPFDANQIPTECFGGEITSKTYDSITDKFLDLCFEKTNSAYMLFYERIKFDNQKSHKGSVEGGSKDQPDAEEDTLSLSATTESPITLKPELKNWIWRDNTQFLQEKNIFEHSYFEFMFQLCSHIPQTLDDVTENSDMACQLCTTFFLETLMHSKEKPTMVQWVELLTKQFQASQNACEWFLHRMTVDNWWPIQNLFKCPNQMVRQVYQRLCIHVMQCLRGNHASFLKKNSSSSSSGNDSNDSFESPEKVECSSCVTSFIRALVNLFIAHGKVNWKHLAEFFTLFSEFNKLGSEETQFILNIHAIYSMVNFYLTNKPVDTMDIITEEEEEEDTILPLTEKGRPASLEKMISFICGVLEKAKKLDLDIPAIDYNILTGKSFAFITQQIKDNVSLHYTRNLIQILTKWNEAVAIQLVSVLVSTIQKHCNNLEACQPFYKLLSGLIDAPPQPGLPNYMEIILLRVWEIADFMPYSVLEWLSLQVTKNQSIASWVIQGMNLWAEKFLLCSMNQRVRSVSAHLIANLVPNNTFRQTYRTSRALCPPPKDIIFTTYEREILHKVYINLLKLLKTARLYVDTAIHHCANKLICYFSILNYYTLSRQEKLLCGPFVTDLWHVYYPQLAELTIPVNQNKQVVLIFMHNILTDCPENVKRLLQINSVINNIAYNYILTDNDDQEVIMYNRLILPAFYGILRMMCEQSVSFTKQLSKNKNVIWGIKHLALNPTVYANAIEELFKLLKMFITIRPEHTEEDIHRIKVLQRQILLVYLRGLDPHSGWATFIPAVKTLVDGDEARHYFVLNNGFVMMLSTFTLLHNMYHEATACHVYTDLLDVVNIISESVKYIRTIVNDPEIQKKMNSFKEWPDIIRKMTTLLNTYNCNQMRSAALSTLTELIYIRLSDVVESVVPMLLEYHTQYHENDGDTVPLGPYFPRSTHKPPSTINKNSARPPRPLIQMSVSQHQIDPQHGVNPEYDTLLHNYYFPYHLFIDLLCEEAAKHGSMSEQLVMLYTAVGLEGAPLRFTLFPKFCLRVFEEKILNKEHISVLVKSIYLHEYVEHVLFEDRAILTSDYVYEAFKILVTKIGRVIINDRNCKIMETTVLSFDSKIKPSDEDLADTIDTLRALDLFYSCAFLPPPHLEHKLKVLLEKLSIIEKSRKPTVHRGPPAGRRLDHFGRSAEGSLEKLMDNEMPDALDQEKSRNVGILNNSVVIIDDESGGTEEVVDDELEEEEEEEEEECIEDGEIEISDEDDDDDEDEQLDEEDISEDVDDELENNEELEEEEEDTVASENQSQESDADSKTESTNTSQERVYNGSAGKNIDALIDIIEHRANDSKNAKEFRDSS